MDVLAKPVPPITRKVSLDRGLAPSAATAWLKAGWRDFVSVNMGASLLYGLIVFAISALIIGGLFAVRADYALFPALGGFMVFGPALAIGLYEKSRRIQAGEPVTFIHMIDGQPKSTGQVLFIGVILALLGLLWMRAAVLLYALFFGLHDFSSLDSVMSTVLTSPRGWALLGVGSLFGALFAALAFSISALSVPMLLNEDTDTFSAMGASMTLIWHNLPVMLAWGIIVMAIFIACLATGLLGLIIGFPVLGHATWHAYLAIRGEPGTPVLTPAIDDPS